ncbi:MAG: CinA family protein [Candidatus Dormibacteria bacterium]
MGGGVWGGGITGVAGPGSSDAKPPGLIFVAVASARSTRLGVLDEDLGRQANRSAAVELALGLLEQELAL